MSYLFYEYTLSRWSITVSLGSTLKAHVYNHYTRSCIQVSHGEAAVVNLRDRAAESAYVSASSYSLIRYDAQDQVGHLRRTLMNRMVFGLAVACVGLAIGGCQNPNSDSGAAPAAGQGAASAPAATPAAPSTASAPAPSQSAMTPPASSSAQAPASSSTSSGH